MTTKSPEEIGAQCCRKIAKQGAHAGPEIIAAAIREDRAERVSEAEVGAAREIFTKRRCHCPDCVRAALEVARKARAG